MKTLLLVQNNKWTTLKKRVKVKNKDLSARYLESEGTESTTEIKNVNFLNPRLTFDLFLDQSWFHEKTKEYRDNYDVILWLISPRQWKKWGGNQNARAFYMPDSIGADHKLDAVLICDEKSVYTTPDGKKHREFEYSWEHELAHAKSLDIGLKLNPDNAWHLTPYREGYDNTHYFFHKGDIEGFYKDFNKQWSVRSSVLSRVLNEMKDLIKVKEKKVKPLEDKYWNRVTQGYGVPNPIYKTTGHHIGTDFGCPVGTPIYARENGIITTTGTDSILGNYCYFKIKDYEDRYLHLREVPKAGAFLKGDIIAYTGNTGMSTGAHLHIDVFKGSVQKVTKANWRDITIDPLTI